MTARVTRGRLQIAQSLYDFVEADALPGTDIESDHFWQALDGIFIDWPL